LGSGSCGFHTNMAAVLPTAPIFTQPTASVTPQTPTSTTAVSAIPQATQTNLVTQPSIVTTTPEVTRSPDIIQGEACLAGEWKLTDANGYFEQALRASSSPATLEGVTGSLIYTFFPQGRLEILFDDFTVTLNAPVEGGSMLTRSLLDGSAEANFKANEEHEMVYSAFGGDGVVMVLEVDGQLLVQTTLPAWASFFAALSQASGGTPPAETPFAPVDVKAGYDCVGDRLVLRGEGLPVEMTLTRIMGFP
jgi:hypothetical protein